jgi:predicted dehydrogenase
MSKKVRWGVISTANIGTAKVIPGMQKAENLEITAISSRNPETARKAAKKLSIPKAYGSYDEILKDSEIDAVYIPLPNHLHVEWAAKCIEAGKHVLCEKPLSLDLAGVRKLIQLRDKHKVKVGEAFMVKKHPQWFKARELVQGGALGKITSIQCFFSYFLDDPENVRNIPQYGGGGMWDIGCYPLVMSRFVLGVEPRRVISLLEYDPEMKVDRLGSIILDFPGCQASFAVGTQTVPYQRIHFFGTKKRLELEIPWNAPPDRPCRLTLDSGDLFGEKKEEITIDTIDQYTAQGESFSQAILDDRPAPVPLEDTFKNTAALLAIYKSAKSGNWETPVID